VLWGFRWGGRLMFAASATLAVVVHRRFEWVPLPYLAAMIAVPAVGSLLVRRSPVAGSSRWAITIVSATIFVAMCPVPWMRAAVDDPPGNAWRLDGRIAIAGDVVDPPGEWYWLTVGRPPIVAEVVRGWFAPEAERVPASMAAGRRTARPAFSEPAAAAVGLRRAGWPVRTELVIELTDPLEDHLAPSGIVAQLNGAAISTRAEWESALDQLGEVNTLTTVGGDTIVFDDAVLPYGRVDLIELPADDLEVVVGGAMARTWPGRWYRSLSLGSSHGLMVALVAYAHGSGDDLARGRVIAGTGRMLPDGTIGTIGGLRAKAGAARELGADVLLFPTSQAAQLDGFDAGSMRLIPVASLDEAIDALSAPAEPA
jgi:hypothetical protein